jgi:hypothetical protein
MGCRHSSAGCRAIRRAAGLGGWQGLRFCLLLLSLLGLLLLLLLGLLRDLLRLLRLPCLLHPLQLTHPLLHLRRR